MSNTFGNNRIMIAATGSGRGKTTITSGLLKLLKNKDYDVHSFKCGPDFIDPMYHENVLGIPSKNLDPFFCDDELLAASFLEGAGDINVIEACMGLYDGLGVTRECSSYSVAKSLKCPIVLVVDGFGMGASIVAEILGFKLLDEDNLIRGVFLNRVSKTYAGKIAQEIESCCKIPVVGYLPKQTNGLLKSRHLGLLSPEENDADASIEVVAEALEEGLDLEKLFELSGADEINVSKALKEYIKTDLSHRVIGVPRDKAFSFYYKDNLLALEYAGAKLVYFSPLEDAFVPEEVNALYIGGGYPENYLKKLSKNESMKTSILHLINEGCPVVAECGGFMYLTKSIEGYEMVGAIDDECFRTKGLVRFGYVNGSYKQYKLKGHEFHHYDVSNPGNEIKMKRASTADEYFACRKVKNCIAGFPHFYFFSDPEFIKEFV